MNRNHLLLFVFVMLSACSGDPATSTNDPKLVLVTLDGYRWQELFYGIDSALMESEYNSEKEWARNHLWTIETKERSMKLNPFFEGFLKENGVILGNRREGSLVNCRNSQWFSYPGYNEILTGSADDDRITSNDKIPNPNVTFLEKLNEFPEYRGKVAAFTSWDVFPYIINRKRSGIYVNAGFDSAELPDVNSKEKYLYRIQEQTTGPWTNVRLDVFTHNFALEYMKSRKPSVVYIAYGETDDFAHEGDYDQYLKSAKLTNEFLEELWNYIQSDDHYRDQTTLIITTDHGRGSHPLSTWRSHGSGVAGADQIFIGAIGPGIKKGVEIKGQFYQDQVAATAMKALGQEWGDGKVLEEIFD